MMRRLYDLWLWLCGLPKPKYYVLLTYVDGGQRYVGPMRDRFTAEVFVVHRMWEGDRTYREVGAARIVVE